MSRRKKMQEIAFKESVEKTTREFLFSEEAQEVVRRYDAQQNPPNRFNNFKMPEPFKNPEFKTIGDKQTLTNDSMPINNFDFQNFGKINKTLINSWFMGFQELSLLSQNGIIQNIVQTYAQECVRKWIKIVSVSKKGDKSDKIAQLSIAFETFKVKDKIRLAVELSVLMGGCKIYPKLKGDDSKEGGDELTTPFYKEKMKKGDLLYLKVIEATYVTPIQFNAVNPLLEDFYEPEIWTVLATPIHTSRLCHFAYNYVPTLLKPVYMFYGMPLVQLCLDYIFGFETVRQNVVGISGRYNLNIFKTNINSLLHTGGSALKEGCDLETRLKIAQYYQTNFSIFAMSSDDSLKEEWQQFNMTIAGLDGLLNQNAELVCAVSRIPAIKLFGTSPKGFNSTGENEVRIFYDLIGSFQNSVVQPSLQQIFELIQINEFGKIDEDLQIVFEPLWEPNPLEKAQIQSIQKDINIAYAQETIITPEEIREKLNEDPDSGFSDLSANFEMDDEDELSDEESKTEKEDNFGE